MTRIAINTGGGDAPGLNAVIRAVALSALNRGWDVLGIARGYDGLLCDKPSVIQLDRSAVRGIAHLGGTILGTTNRGDPFRYPVERDGVMVPTDRSELLVQRFRDHGIDALVALGGDGSLALARRLMERGLPRVVGVPKTIDNDLRGTNVTFGFCTAVETTTEALDRLHSTAQAHRRVMVVEVMGRDAGWIALHAGIAGSADVILIPEIPFEFERVCEKLHDRYARGSEFAIVVVSEGAKELGHHATYKQDRIQRACGARWHRRAAGAAHRGDDRLRVSLGRVGPPATRRFADQLRSLARTTTRLRGGPLSRGD